MLQVRTSNRILEDGVVISNKNTRTIFQPGADLSGEDARAVAIANAVWTDDVISAYATWRADELTRTGEVVE